MDETRRVRIAAGTMATYAELNTTTVADSIWQALPLEVKMQTWGEELYGAIPLSLPLESPQEVVDRGDLAYWPPGHAVCIFFGPTPASIEDEPRAAGEVTVFGHVDGDASVFRLVRTGEKVRFEQA